MPAKMPATLDEGLRRVGSMARRCVVVAVSSQTSLASGSVKLQQSAPSPPAPAEEHIGNLIWRQVRRNYCSCALSPPFLSQNVKVAEAAPTVGVAS